MCFVGATLSAADKLDETMARRGRSNAARGAIGRRDWALVCAALLFVSACGRASADPARFTGKYGVGSTEPAAVTEHRNKPLGHATLGHVKAQCRVDEGVRSLRDAWLADVDCSEDLLVAALREKAASVGGHAIVGRECRRDEQSRGELWKSTLLTCSAIVTAEPGAEPVPRAAGARSARGPAPAAPLLEPLEYASPTQAFRVKVTLSATEPNRPPRAPKPPDRVAELAVLPVSDVVMGDIVARCRGECERAAVRYAVRAAAGRVGANDVVAVTCVRSADGVLCTGRAAKPEADPETDFLAR
jgi:hypothetical protein